MTAMRYWRLTRGLSQRQLAERVGCTREHISQMESDTARPKGSITMLKKVAAALQVTLEELTAETPPEPTTTRAASRG
jgi:transcriptional regulator with XRE-family HTH domain